MGDLRIINHNFINLRIGYIDVWYIHRYSFSVKIDIESVVLFTLFNLLDPKPCLGIFFNCFPLRCVFTAYTQI